MSTLCSKCGSTEDACERYSFGVYAGTLCYECCFKYRDHCGVDQDQGTAAEYEAAGERYWEDD